MACLPQKMLATVYNGAGENLSFVPKEVPRIQKDTDIVVRVHKTTICGTDLHVQRGAVVTAPTGVTLGHECIGHVVAVGQEVSKHKIGDRVLVPCITRCGKCKACKEQFYGHCEDGGWMFGHTIDGFQTEYARVPHADESCYKLPEHVSGAEENKYLMLADILPTGFEIGLLDGNFQEGQTLAVVGAGPVGLAVILAAVAVYKPSRVFAVDLSDARLAKAKDMGATDLISNANGDAVQQVMQLTDQVGVDCVVEAIGLPAGWEISQDIVRAGGHIAVLGVHGKPATINLERMWYRNFRMSAGMVHCHTIQMLMDKIESGELSADKLISHHMQLGDMMGAYDAFRNGTQELCLKVLITNNLSPPVRSAL
jgi:alcohol dehydrogenase